MVISNWIGFWIGFTLTIATVSMVRAFPPSKTIQHHGGTSKRSISNLTYEDEYMGKYVYGAAAEEGTNAQVESREEICRMEADPGQCRAYFAYTYWYHDAESGECKEFIYGGCGGNKNQGTGARQSNMPFQCHVRTPLNRVSFKAGKII